MLESTMTWDLTAISTHIIKILNPQRQLIWNELRLGFRWRSSPRIYRPSAPVSPERPPPLHDSAIRICVPTGIPTDRGPVTGSPKGELAGIVTRNAGKADLLRCGEFIYSGGFRAMAEAGNFSASVAAKPERGARIVFRQPSLDAHHWSFLHASGLRSRVPVLPSCPLHPFGRGRGGGLRRS